MSKLNKESEAYKKLAAEKSELSARLTQLQDEETEALKNYVSTSKDSNSVKEAQIRLLELEAMRRIELARKNLNNEESIAQEILNINQWLSDEKTKLDKDYVSLAVDGADEIIKKYEELRDK
jgi:ribose 5-phosphate isomerase